MSIVRGSDLKLLIGDFAGSGGLMLDGLRLVSFTVSNQVVDTTTGVSDGWRKLLSGAGLRAIELISRGLFLGGPAAERLRLLALTGAAEKYDLFLEDGVQLGGDFIVKQLSYGSPHDEELIYELTLASAGAVTIS